MASYVRRSGGCGETNLGDKLDPLKMSVQKHFIEVALDLKITCTHRFVSRFIGVTQKAYLACRVHELFCRLLLCGIVQSKAQDRGWALLDKFYSNMLFVLSVW